MLANIWEDAFDYVENIWLNENKASGNLNPGFPVQMFNDFDIDY